MGRSWVAGFVFFTDAFYPFYALDIPSESHHVRWKATVYIALKLVCIYLSDLLIMPHHFLARNCQDYYSLLECRMRSLFNQSQVPTVPSYSLDREMGQYFILEMVTPNISLSQM